MSNKTNQLPPVGQTLTQICHCQFRTVTVTFYVSPLVANTDENTKAFTLPLRTSLIHHQSHGVFASGNTA